MHLWCACLNNIGEAAELSSCKQYRCATDTRYYCGGDSTFIAWNVLDLTLGKYVNHQCKRLMTNCAMESLIEQKSEHKVKAYVFSPHECNGQKSI